MKKKICVRLLRKIGAILPPSYEKPFGPMAKKIRYFLAKQISDNIGNNVNIEQGGYELPDTVIGDNSSVGVDCEIAKGMTIGKNVFMGPECLFYSTQHKFDPVTKQYDGYTEVKPIVIEDNVWLGRRAIIMGGVTIGEGSTIGAAAVVTKDVPPYSVAAGNPATIRKKLID